MMNPQSFRPLRRLLFPLLLCGPAAAAPIITEVSSASQFVYAGDVSASDLLHGLVPVTTGWNTGRPDFSLAGLLKGTALGSAWRKQGEKNRGWKGKKDSFPGYTSFAFSEEILLGNKSSAFVSLHTCV